MPLPTTSGVNTAASRPSSIEEELLRGLWGWSAYQWQQYTSSNNSLTSVNWAVSLSSNTLLLQAPLPVTSSCSSTTFPALTYPAMWLPRAPSPEVVIDRAAPPPTRRHVAEVDRQAQEQQRRVQEERRRQLEMGEQRALVLLRECLSSEQRAEFDAHGRFHVRAGRRLFRLERRWSGNIIEVDPREPQRELAVYCAHPNGVPLSDALVAQKLFLEGGADSLHELLAVANRHR